MNRLFLESSPECSSSSEGEDDLGFSSKDENTSGDSEDDAGGGSVSAVEHANHSAPPEEYTCALCEFN